MLPHSLEATAETTAALFVNCNQNNKLVYWTQVANQWQEQGSASIRRV